MMRSSGLNKLYWMGQMKNIIDKILDKHDDDILEIEGKNHEVFRFEQLALLEIDGIQYTILHPLASDVGEDDVLIFRIEMDLDEAFLVLEEDERTLEECFKLYEQLYSSKNS